MKFLAKKDDKEIWFQEISRPYHVDPPFPGEQYVCILFANDEVITPAEQMAISEQLVSTGCRSAVCAGHECSTWDDSVDFAALAKVDYKPTDEDFVLTTWHEDQSVEDVIFAGLFCSNFDDYNFKRYLVLSVGTRRGLLDDVQRGIKSVWK